MKIDWIVQKIDLIVEYRFKKEFSNLKDDSQLNEIQLKRLDSIMITVKNGLDTSVCNGSTGSSYISNQKYQKYQLIKDGSKLSIIEKK